MADKRIPHSMSVLNVKTPELKDMIMNDVRQEKESKPHFFISMNRYTIILMDFHQFPREFAMFIKDNMIDQDMKQDLTSEAIINWCRTLRPLYPLKTKGI